jgi:hypothetical protein
MAIFHLILSWWRARQRRVDLELLWPTCKQLAPDLDHARMAFAVHALQDPAWLTLGMDRLQEEIDRLA